MRGMVRGAVAPAVREGRVVRIVDGALLVSIRSLMGDPRPVVTRGYAPRIVPDGDGVALLEAERGDPVWVAQDEGGALVVVAWEPAA